VPHGGPGRGGFGASALRLEEPVSVHRLKVHPEPFAAAKAGRKRFEFRRDDRSPPFAVDDVLELAEWDPEREAFTGEELEAGVSYVLRDAFGVPPGYAVLSLAGAEWEVRFVESVRKHVDAGRELTEAQRLRAEQVDEERVR
jgi:hypothetical protein